MADRRPLGPIRRRSPTPTEDQIAHVMRYYGGRTLASHNRVTAWLESFSSPVKCCLHQLRLVDPMMLPWWDYLTHIVRMVSGDNPVFMTVYAPDHETGCRTLYLVQYGVTFEQIWWPWADVTTIVAIGEFHPADCVAKRSAVEATLKELWGKAGVVVPDFRYFKLKANEADDATITTTAIAVCESFKHSSVEVKIFGQSPERRNFSVLGTIENRPYLPNLTALLQALLYLETHEGVDIVDVNRAQYLSAVSRLDD
ncbi:hypothetical protein ACP4OV_012535 [Aristida adscensionis]